MERLKITKNSLLFNFIFLILWFSTCGNVKRVLFRFDMVMKNIEGCSRSTTPWWTGKPLPPKCLGQAEWHLGNCFVGERLNHAFGDRPILVRLRWINNNSIHNVDIKDACRYGHCRTPREFQVGIHLWIVGVWSLFNSFIYYPDEFLNVWTVLGNDTNTICDNANGRGQAK